jgi:hypothetical protein
MVVANQVDNAGLEYVVKTIAVGGQKPSQYGSAVSPATVTQATNRTTGVTINATSGQITTNNASLAAEASAIFTVTNSFVAANDIVLVNIKGGSNGGNTDVLVTAVAAGSFNIMVANNNASAGTAETGAIVISFVVVKVYG